MRVETRALLRRYRPVHARPHAIPTELGRRLRDGPADLAVLRDLLAEEVAPIEAEGTPWTDDRAPVEWITDRMIISYAAEGGRLNEDYLPTRPTP